jgi:hypothetical protein
MTQLQEVQTLKPKKAQRNRVRFQVECEEANVARVMLLLDQVRMALQFEISDYDPFWKVTYSRTVLKDSGSGSN